MYRDILSLDLEIGDVLLFYDKENISSKIIWWATRESKKDIKISHSAMYIGDDLICDILPPGVMYVNKNYYNKKKYTIYVLRSKPKIDKEKILEIARRDTGIVKYDYIQLFRIICKKFFLTIPCIFKNNSKRKQICSEWVVDTLNKAGVNLMEDFKQKKSEMVTPLDIIKSPKLTIIHVEDVGNIPHSISEIG